MNLWSGLFNGEEDKAYGITIDRQRRCLRFAQEAQYDKLVIFLILYFTGKRPSDHPLV